MINLGKNLYEIAGQAYKNIGKSMQNLAKNPQKLNNNDSITINSSNNLNINSIIDPVSLSSNNATSVANNTNKHNTLTKKKTKNIQNLDLWSLNSNNLAKTDSQTNEPGSMFSKILRRKVNQIRSAEAYALAESKGNASLVQVVKNINQAELKLTEIVNVRDKFVNFLLEIFKMPL